MRATKTQYETSWIALLGIILSSSVIGWYIVFLGRGIAIDYESIDRMSEKISKSEFTKVELRGNDKPLIIPGSGLFADNEPWMYVAASRPVPAKYQPRDLVEVNLPHGDSNIPIRLQSRTAEQLQTLFGVASERGISLMVSSAYRSIEDQEKLYNDFVTKQGKARADQYVAKPGTSEHHTGFAADVTDASPACAKDSDRCSLSPATAAWLAETAPKYGFIIRYPAGKQPVTGTAYEPWHLRYVGVAFAEQATKANLTFDEFIEQAAPGKKSSYSQTQINR